MPRRSKAEQETSLVQTAGDLARLIEPPDLLTDEQSLIWRSIVASKPIDYFDPGSLDLLVAYCQAVTEHRSVGELIKTFNPKCLRDEDSDGLDRYEQLLRMQDRLASQLVRLSTKMRLSQQAKYRADAAAVSAKKVSRARPWADSTGGDEPE